jgi:hypothetical protein
VWRERWRELHEQRPPEQHVSDDEGPSGARVTTSQQELLRLQQSAGNAAVQRMLRPGGPPATRQIARVVAVGGTLPDLEDLAATRAGRALPRDEMRLIEKEAIDAVRAAAYRKAKAEWSLMTEGDVDYVVNNLKEEIDNHDSWMAASAALRGSYYMQGLGKRDLLTELNKALRPEIAARLRAKFGPQATAAANADAGKVPAPDEAKRFAAALRKMPGFGELLDHVKGGKIVRGLMSVFGKKPVLASWKDGGSLQDQVTSVEPRADSPKVETGYRDGSFAKAVAEADDFYKRLAEAETLGNVTRPKIKVHLEAGQTAGTVGAFRAYQSGAEVHVAQDSPLETIVHEVGHHLENELPADSWRAIQGLLRARHTAAKGADMTAGDTGFGEARYQGDYPATGPYTSRAYDDAPGATEVTSMTLELLSQPDKVDTMLDKDPTQVAVVIRALRPKSYAAHADLRPFDEYLP